MLHFFGVLIVLALLGTVVCWCADLRAIIDDYQAAKIKRQIKARSR